MVLDKPPWLKINAVSLTNLKVKRKVSENSLNTVCQSAHCPNICECWENGTATFMLLGNVCTRHCSFCSINCSKVGEKLDENEPKKVLNAIKELNLDYVVLTCVTRDDLADFGSKQMAKTILLLKNKIPKIKVEILSSDLNGNLDSLKTILNSNPNVFGHNIETVKRLQNVVRDKRANYEKSLLLLKNSKKLNEKIFTKSSIMVGLGETKEEVFDSLKDLKENKVDFVTIGQYLQPSKKHLEVKEYIYPKVFEKYKEFGEKIGLKMICSPFVRSSFKAHSFFN